MNEDLSLQNQPLEQEWQAPPTDNSPVTEPAQMSEVGTLGGIFFEPGATFEDLRRKPRFIAASLMMVALLGLFLAALYGRLGYERIVRERLEASAMYQSQPPEAQKKMIEQQSSPIVKYITMAVAPIAVLISFLIGGLIYWGGVNAMGGSMTFLRGVSVWVYASFPAFVVKTLADVLVLFLKSPDEVDAVASQQGLIQASPAFFIDTKAAPVLGAILGTFDVFFIWGWILAVIGLRIVGKISTGAACGIVFIVALLNVAIRVVIALFS